MAVTLNTTVGGASANSYVTITEADNHYEVKPFFVGIWNSLNNKTGFTGVTKGATTTYTFSADPTTKFKVGQTVTVSDAGTGYNANQTIIDTTSTTVVTDLDSASLATISSGFMQKTYAKEHLLIEATKLIDMYHFKGDKVSDTFDNTNQRDNQALKFPRYIDTPSTTSSEIPSRIKLATLEAVIFLHQQRDAQGRASASGAVTKIAVGTGQVAGGLVQLEYGSLEDLSRLNNATGGTLEAVKNYLLPYLIGDIGDTSGSFNFSTI